MKKRYLFNINLNYFDHINKHVYLTVSSNCSGYDKFNG